MDNTFYSTCKNTKIFSQFLCRSSFHIKSDKKQKENILIEFPCWNYHYMTPSTCQSCDAMIRLNTFPTFWTTSVAISFNPVMEKLCSTTLCLFRFHISCYTWCGSTLNTSFVYGVFAYWKMVDWRVWENIT